MNYIILQSFRDATLYELRNAVSLAAQDLRISLGEARLQNKLYKDLTGLNVEGNRIASLEDLSSFDQLLSLNVWQMS